MNAGSFVPAKKRAHSSMASIGLLLAVALARRPVRLVQREYASEDDLLGRDLSLALPRLGRVVQQVNSGQLPAAVAA
jgi:hypothetical protein